MGKLLIAYYSRPRSINIDGKTNIHKLGNTEQVAQKLQQLTKADIYRIDTAISYPDNGDTLSEQAKLEKETKLRPKIKGKIPNMSHYDIIILGYPIWHDTMPMVVMSFLESADFTNKIIIPFATHEISHMGNSENDLKIACPNAIILPGTALLATTLFKANEAIASIAEVAMHPDHYL